MSLKDLRHSDAFKQRATDLFFEIEKHFKTGGSSLRLREVREMLGVNSNSTANKYIAQLVQWKLIKKVPRGIATIVLAETPYPPV